MTLVVTNSTVSSVTSSLGAASNAIFYGSELYLGFAFAVTSSIFIGSSFIIKKKSLLALGRTGGTRAGAGGYGYLRHWMWWAGFLFLGIGEALNFVAYAFAPATLVTPLGALSVLVTAILSSFFLGETLNILGKVGCALCILGSMIVVIHAPKEVEVYSMDHLTAKLVDPTFLVYVVVVLCVSFVLIVYCAPRYGSQNVMIYLAICSLIGGFSVLGVKVLGLAVKESLSGRNEFNDWQAWFALLSLTVCVCTQMNYLNKESLSGRNEFNDWQAWFALLSLTVCVCTQMNYLNKALDIFNTSVVTPIYYVSFTTCVIFASAMLFKEWKSLAVEDIISVLAGFATVVIGIFLLNAFKETDIPGKNWSILFSSMANSSEDWRTSAASEMLEPLITEDPIPDIESVTFEMTGYKIGTGKQTNRSVI